MYQFQFLSSCQFFELQLPAQCVSFGSFIFAVDQLHRAAGGGVSGAFPVIVGCDPPFEIIGDPGIQCPVAAADDVAVIRFESFLRFRSSASYKDAVKRHAQTADEVIHKIHTQIGQDKEAEHQDLRSLSLSAHGGSKP